MKLEEENCTKTPVRAMTFEVKEGCETIDLKNFSNLKAAVVTNCRSVVTFRIAGLTALAVLDISGFRQLPKLECYDLDNLHASWRNVKMLNLESGRDAIDKWQQSSSIVPTYNLQASSIFNLLHPFKNYVSAFMKQPFSLELAKHMKGLQVLHLKNTGITDLDDMGSCSWPHLQELQVEEYLLERFRLGHLPVLQKLEFNSCELWSSLEKKRKRGILLEGKDLLKGCPALQTVDITSDLFKSVGLMKPTWRSVRSLSLIDVSSAMELVDIASSAHSLEELVIEVKFGLRALPSLRNLEIDDLSEPNCFSGLVHLQVLNLEQYHLIGGSKLQRGVDFNSLGFEGLSNLESLTIAVVDKSLVLNLKQCLGGSKLQSGGTAHISGASPTVDLVHVKRNVNQESHGWPTLLLDTLHLSDIPARHSLTEVELKGLRHVRRIEGIECFTNLRSLEISWCPFLEELHSLHALEEIKSLEITHCVKLKAVQGCGNMTKLKTLRLNGCESMEQLPFTDHRSSSSDKASPHEDLGTNSDEAWRRVLLVDDEERRSLMDHLPKVLRGLPLRYFRKIYRQEG
ncbi:hypothetical protein GOP47_0024756 [Adiantum capillus-veneris]|uniref:Uncharacterized protein n=1 Tax=Adiantum capillus-veneris TaxID=13818 RepID=A0A9D4U2C4_ADICA|nr:hypothetical protein GOP47_0024756 [Adiantum capillus-veneris]